jgi:GT2 family glycosyltransferase
MDGTDQGTARTFPSPLAAFFGRKSLLTRLAPSNPWSRRYLAGRQRQGRDPFRVDWVSGACLMTRQDVIERVGPLDERFFMYWEDADWCQRIGQLGLGVYCVPEAEVRHAEGQSGRGHRARLIWEFHKSVYWYYVKHHLPQPWNPARPLVAAGLFGRAALMIAALQVARLAHRTTTGHGARPDGAAAHGAVRR